ncbi:MAG: ADP-ribose-binding protein [Geobacter sp.]|nr:ADP-ribose-binding protein [Geobacter sp.]
MLEIEGDIWKYYGQNIIAITVNGSLTRDGRAVMGRGVAKQAADRIPGLAENLGGLITAHGNHVFDLGNGIVSYPVEETAWSLPDLRIIVRSALQLVKLTDVNGWRQVIVPRPGCGGGGLAWHEVRPLLEPIFDERFLAISSMPVKS